jgi:2-C-methyl-D-erythritol 2,4-cyclodiphosphate synthase
MRIGFGFDVHQLTPERDLWLGGVKIPASRGALGHSDADVLLHAICDAILGALALGDIGKHFPDTDAAFKGIDSKVLLSKVIALIDVKGYKISNIDSTLCLESPKIMSYAPEMRNVIAGICHITPDDVSIKATTNEKMGFIGRHEGVTAYAVVLLVKKS